MCVNRNTEQSGEYVHMRRQFVDVSAPVLVDEFWRVER